MATGHAQRMCSASRAEADHDDVYKALAANMTAREVSTPYDDAYLLLYYFWREDGMMHLRRAAAGALTSMPAFQDYFRDCRGFLF